MFPYLWYLFRLSCFKHFSQQPLAARASKSWASFVYSIFCLFLRGVSRMKLWSLSSKRCPRMLITKYKRFFINLGQRQVELTQKSTFLPAIKWSPLKIFWTFAEWTFHVPTFRTFLILKMPTCRREMNFQRKSWSSLQNKNCFVWCYPVSLGSIIVKTLYDPFTIASTTLDP